MKKFENFLALLKNPTIYGAILFVSLFLTLAPTKILAKLSLLDLVSKNKVIISLCLLITTGYFLTIIIKDLYQYIKSEFKIYQKRQINIEYLLALSSDNKKTVAEMYKGDRSAYFQINDANTGLLVAYNIIGNATQVGIGRTTFGYFLQPWVIQYLDKNYDKFIKEVKE
ncbi:MAG: superinfection exclusion B family protein [Bacteroidales bacterium]|nr:superinfection exclusion B family protein [Bacteroidales bacterium]